MFLFGRKFQEQVNARFHAYETRLNTMEARLARVETDLDRRVHEILTRYEQHPDERVRFLLNSVADELRAALAQSLEEARQVTRFKESAEQLHARVETMAQGKAAGEARFRAALNTVYRAPYTGFVFMFFKGGITGAGSLLVGSQSPPAEPVCAIGNINTYAGVVVRAGEFWMAKCDSSSVHCIYTPFL